MDGSLPDLVIVTGASGFVGQNLVKYLWNKVDLLAVTRNGEPMLGVPVVRFSNLAGVSVPRDTVLINAAARIYYPREPGPEPLTENVGILNKIYEFCVRNDVREVRQLGSISVYDGDEGRFTDHVRSRRDLLPGVDLNESPHPGELTYAWSKRIGEIYARLFSQKHGISTITFRLASVYGPHDCVDPDRAHVIPALIMKVLGSEPFRVRDPSASRDFVYVNDVCRVVTESLLTRGVTDSFNLGSGVETKVSELVALILELTGSDKMLGFGPDDYCPVRTRRCPIEKLRERFLPSGFEFIPLREGLINTIEWYRSPG